MYLDIFVQWRSYIIMFSHLFIGKLKHHFIYIVTTVIETVTVLCNNLIDHRF